jgi:soluble lytic murein transglycosylase-like protein
MDGLDPDLIKAVAMVESGFDPGAVSPKGAMGLMQLMPETAAQYGVRDALDPYESLRAGSRHLRDLLDGFDGNVTLALAAYNAGAGAVRRYGGVPAYRETRDYVDKVQTKLNGAGRSDDPPSPEDEPVIVVRVDDDGSVSMSN